ncbi:hypothetical protein [Falsiroseomonas sp. HW251]|uniref:hypothetical protein n=1 Tax=Falsiroseomonas sp. HW251 TaxID=3390998 RepID=UPI003D3164F1
MTKLGGLKLLRSHGARLCLMLIAGVVLALALELSAAAKAQVATRTGSPIRHRIGLYVTDLHSLDPSRGTFGATLWVWSVDPVGEPALRTMEFANADRTTVKLETVALREGVSWSQRSVVGTFRHAWDLRNFPFDRHSLEIWLEEGAQEENVVAYEADAANSGHALYVPIQGWRVAGMRLEVASAHYATSFGDPASPEPTSRFARLRAVIELERADFTGFLKLTATLYAAFLICVIGNLMVVTSTTFAPRITLLGISLFALVVSMRSASATLGSEHAATLIDKLHAVGLAYVVAVTAVTVVVRMRLEVAPEGTSRLARLDRWGCLAAATLFLLVNGWLLLWAAGKA